MEKVLVTGARSGLMGHLIDRLINDYYIYVTVHTESQLKAVLKKYKGYDNVKCLKLDMLNDKDIEKVKDLDIDILVSSAAIGESGSLLDLPLKKLKANFEVNVFANFKLVQMVLQKMVNRGHGKVIIMGSLAGLMPFPFGGAYSASKASIIKLTEALNFELKLLDTKVKLVLILPGLYRTGFNKLLFDGKYDFMDRDSYFKYYTDLIRKSENIVLKLFEKKKFDSIINKLEIAVRNPNPKFIYRAPFSQSLFARIIALFY